MRNPIKVKLEVLGVPLLAKLIGKRSEHKLDGGTVNEFVALLEQRYGKQVVRAILDEEGKIDYSIQVMINDQGFLDRDQYGTHQLQDGDEIKFMLLVGGG